MCEDKSVSVTEVTLEQESNTSFEMSSTPAPISHCSNSETSPLQQ